MYMLINPEDENLSEGQKARLRLKNTQQNENGNRVFKIFERLVQNISLFLTRHSGTFIVSPLNTHDSELKWKN